MQEAERISMNINKVFAKDLEDQNYIKSKFFKFLFFIFPCIIEI